MSRIKTDYIFSSAKRDDDEKASRRAIEAVREVVRASRRVDTSKVDRAKAAFFKAVDDAVKKFDISK